MLSALVKLNRRLGVRADFEEDSKGDLNFEEVEEDAKEDLKPLRISEEKRRRQLEETGEDFTFRRNLGATLFSSSCSVK
jgi:hypothetical protein